MRGGAAISVLLPLAFAVFSPRDSIAETDLQEILARDRGWPAGTVRDQLDRDPTLVPFGKGAIFVPAMTNPLDEPSVTVMSGGQPVAEGTTGMRIVLSPGTYEVRVGSGTEQQRMRLQATVQESHTTVLPVAWAGLQVHVVDEQFGSLRGSYELIRVQDREYVGIGFGTDEQAGEPVTTWVVRPGLYKIVRVGENYRTRRDFSTVRLTQGQLTHFILVLNKDTGELQGGGEIPEEEVFRPRAGFFGSLVLGGDVSMNARENVPALPEGVSFSVRAFADSRLSAEIFDSPLIFRLQVEQGQTKSPNVPWVKSDDRIKLDGLYVYEINDTIGPYARLSAETNLLPDDRHFTDPVTLEFQDELGVPFSTQMNVSEVRVSPPIGLSTLKEGAGINLRLFKGIFGDATVRTGLGARHAITRDFFESAGTSTTTPATAFFKRRPTVNQIGIEATVLASARITRWVVANLEFDSLFPFDSVESVVIDVDATVAVKLTSYVSINYRIRFLRDPSADAANALQQDILLRFSLELL